MRRLGQVGSLEENRLRRLGQVGSLQENRLRRLGQVVSVWMVNDDDEAFYSLL